ncbi:hypothetical protein [Kosakonia pseudosacchari]|uniref:hypothetical protein n=1 Tax=Kosakonia pseudosacchari TaxID=1646340 RepID=UPI00114306F8|nr:hypothetical protein [Kosakonia pseudosacchari]
MNNKEFAEALKAKKALIVHFSNLASMSRNQPFPDDLKNVIESPTSNPLSCCIVWPGHTMSLPGSVGVIIEPALPNIHGVCATDAGTSDNNGEINSFAKPLSQENLEEIYAFSDPYNECIVIKPKVIGIYIDNINYISVRKKQELRCGDYFESNIGPMEGYLSEIFDCFEGLSIFTFIDGEIVSINRQTPYL